MLLDENTINNATKEELEKAYDELNMYSILTDKEIYIKDMIRKRLSESEN